MRMQSAPMRNLRGSGGNWPSRSIDISKARAVGSPITTSNEPAVTPLEKSKTPAATGPGSLGQSRARSRRGCMLRSQDQRRSDARVPKQKEPGTGAGLPEDGEGCASGRNLNPACPGRYLQFTPRGAVAVRTTFPMARCSRYRATQNPSRTSAGVCKRRPQGPQERFVRKHPLKWTNSKRGARFRRAPTTADSG